MHVLAGMADQATLLGNPAEGRRLAQAGRRGLSRADSSAHAVVGSEKAYERVESAEEHARRSIAYAARQKGARRGAMSQCAGCPSSKARAQWPIKRALHPRRLLTLPKGEG